MTKYIAIFLILFQNPCKFTKYVVPLPNKSFKSSNRPLITDNY